ncbi:MAG: helix-turn-helix domain-containing protein [Clostridia bacterium]|nr:helix-turn-helix domain-containing protein [Clostridia bacterium]
MKYTKFDKEFFFSRVEESDEWDIKENVWHYHNLFEIYLILSGSCSYFIDNKSYKLEAGDIVLIPEGVIHNTEYHNDRHSRLLINCSKRYIPTSVTHYLPSMMYLYRNPDIRDEVAEIFNTIEAEYKNRSVFSEEVIRLSTHMLFFLLARNANRCTKAEAGNEYIERAVGYIQQNFSRELTLGEVSELCSVSPEHFSRMFKKETGFGFCEYVTLLRLQRAEQLLKQEEGLAVSEIAEQCGFDDSNYFSARFKKMYGISPKKFQRENVR